MSILLRLRAALRTFWWGRILAEHDTEPTELAGGLMKLLIGGWLLLPHDTTSTFSLLTIAPEWAWGVVMALLGGGHWFALRDGYVRWRRAAAMLGFLVWFYLALTALWFNPASLGFALFSGLAVSQSWVYVRLGRETG